jgi:hypothetical protein
VQTVYCVNLCQHCWRNLTCYLIFFYFLLFLVKEKKITGVGWVRNGAEVKGSLLCWRD